MSEPYLDQAIQDVAKAYATSTEYVARCHANRCLTESSDLVRYAVQTRAKLLEEQTRGDRLSRYVQEANAEIQRLSGNVAKAQESFTDLREADQESMVEMLTGSLEQMKEIESLKEKLLEAEGALTQLRDWTGDNWDEHNAVVRAALDSIKS